MTGTEWEAEWIKNGKVCDLRCLPARLRVAG